MREMFCVDSGCCPPLNLHLATDSPIHSRPVCVSVHTHPLILSVELHYRLGNGAWSQALDEAGKPIKLSKPKEDAEKLEVNVPSDSSACSHHARSVSYVSADECDVHG